MSGMTIQKKREFALNYKPRPHFIAFHNRTQRFSFVVAHRRSGKSYALLADLLVRALYTKIPNAVFAYIAPELGQARNIAWTSLKVILGEILEHCKVSETRLTITLPNGSVIKLFGLDNAETLRGNGFAGVVLDEAQDISLEVIATSLLPAMADKKAFLVWSGTPKGISNTFFKYREKARLSNGKWFYEELTIEDTDVFKRFGKLKDENGNYYLLQDTCELMEDEEFLQEFYCSWHANSRGSVYGKYIHDNEDNIFDFHHVEFAPVDTIWDLGYHDATAIWFMQKINGRLDVIYYHQTNGQDIESIIDDVQEIAREHRFNLDKYYLPHDAMDKNLQTGKSIIECFWKLRLNAIKIPELSIKQGLSIGRSMMKFFRFHATNCKDGLDALKAYSFKYNQSLKAYSKEPLHNWASHCADAYRYMSIIANLEDQKAERPSKVIIPNDRVHYTEDDMRKLTSLDYESTHEEVDW